MIPKRFHHIWVGGKPLPDKARRFIEDAQRLHPGFEFCFWNEDNLPLDSSFAQRAYARKAWAFVSDYCRFQLLHQQGGIYLDTDMELLKSFEPLLENNGFAGLNRQGDAIYCGVIGAVAGHPLMQAIVVAYDALDEHSLPTSPRLMTRVFQSSGIQDFTIYPYHYFYPVDEGEKAAPHRLRDAYATHHWDESWRSFVPLRRVLRRVGVMGVYHRLTHKNDSLVHYAGSR